ncbi:MAG: hypothetical protein ACRDWG_04750 [Actinomycetes bacterium]
MGIIARLRGTERPPEVQRAVAELELRLPEGWRFVEFRWQLFCRRPVKLSLCGATAEGPDGRRVLAVSTDDRLGVPAVRALADAIEGHAATSPRWAPPRIRPREQDISRGSWPLVEPETRQEATARAEALALLPEGTDLMNVDSEKFGRVPVYAVVVHMPDDLGTAGVGLNRTEAWRALAERLRGELAESAVWFPPVRR